MTTKPFEFEPALKELEDIAGWFESANVDLDQGLVKFERGMELAAQLKAHLAGVENRVEKIKARFVTADGQAAAVAAPGEAAAPATPPQPNATAEAPGEPDQAGLFGV